MMSSDDSSKHRLAACRWPVDSSRLARYGQSLGLSDPGQALLALARSIAASPGWEIVPRAVLVARASPSPVLAVLGHLDGKAEAWLAAQARALDADYDRLRVVRYRQAQEDCVRLASLLLDRFGRDELSRARFTAIPRGGFVVLGLLATALGLEHAQLGPSSPAGRLLVVVDDCALSGSRFRKSLAECSEDQRVAFAHLYSPGALRKAIESSEERVVACLAADDLAVDGRFPKDPSVASQRVEQMQDAYFVGKVEPLAFAWGEPDRLIWNPATARLSQAWRLAPPEHCLKNRVAASVSVQQQPGANGPLAPAAEVVFGELDEHIVLLHLQRMTVAALDDVGSAIWRSILRSGNLDTIGDELAVYEGPKAQIESEAADFTQELIAGGFLEWRVSPNVRTSPS